MKKLVMLLASAAFAAFAETPISVTRGENCSVPSFEKMPYVQEGEAAAIRIPNTGWKVDWQRECPRGSNDVTGLEIESVEVGLRGEKVPAIRITCTPGRYRHFPLVTLPFEVDFTQWNVLSFTAKVEYPEGMKPVMGDSTPMIGWFSSTFLDRWDDFGIAADDGLTYPWAGQGVHVTDFKNHDYPATRTKDGFTDFRWDVPHEERTGYKGFAESYVRTLYFMYDTRKIREGQKVVITIADMKLVKGWHRKFSEPELWAGWKKRVAEYKPDLSDSSYHLEPPKEGRVGFFDRVRLAKGGVAQAEIVVDLSDDILLDNWFKGEIAKRLVIMQTRGKERMQARGAAYELQKWLKELTGGAEFPVVTRPTDPGKHRIFLGAGFAKDLFPEDLAKLADGEGGVDGFAVRVKDGDVYIFGAHPMGTMNGVFTFLENNTDVIWAMANDPDGTIFTPDPDLKVVWGDALEKPAFVIRGWQGGNLVWQRQNRSNFTLQDREYGYGFSLHGGHYLSPQYYDHSEGIQDFNAMIKGERRQPWSEYRMLCCLADPEFPKHAWETVPCLKNLRYGGNFDGVFGTDDNFGVCECPKCTAPIRTVDGRMITPDVDYQAYYGAWYYTYLNKLDDAIQKVMPGYMTSTFAYFFACSYPPIKVNRTISPWLCAYYRKAYNQPIYAPVNQDWWKIYNDWAKHTKQLYLYDYYGLSMNDVPIAEVYQEDLKAQRSIGFLATSTESFGRNQYCGCGDDRWCMARLAWNPDQDLEELHRRFNRRVYREAAPWIDRFRGVIRENWYRNFHIAEHLDEGHETFCMIRALGLDGELRGYLAEAVKAVKNPHSKKLVERLVADYDWCVTTKGWYDAFPSQKNPPKMPKTTPVLSAADIAFTNRIAKATALSKAGNWPGAKEEFLAAAADGLVNPGMRGERLARTLGQLAGDTLKLNAADAMKLWAGISDDGFKKAYGWSIEMETRWGEPLVVRSLAEAFVGRRQPEEAAKVFDIWINWDGNQLPSGLRAARFMKKIDFLRRKKVDVTPYLPGYLAALRDCAKNGATRRERGGAKLRLVREELSKTSVDGRIKGLFEVIGDRFMDNDTRKSGTLLIPEACTVEGKTDWARVAAETVKALDAGDWSDLWRNAYSRQNRTDLRLVALLEIVGRAEKDGAKDIAADLIVKGATVLGYTKDATKESLDRGGPDGFDARVRKLDEAMTRLGVSRTSAAPAPVPPASGAGGRNEKPFGFSTALSSGMVLQRGTASPIWGRAAAGTRVTMEMRDAKNAVVCRDEATADGDGRWVVKTARLPAGGPYSVVVTGADGRIRLDDVLFGDVWLCNGQSNMEFGHGWGRTKFGLERFVTNDYSHIRLLSVPRLMAGAPRRDFPARLAWRKLTAGETNAFSNVGLFFGAHLDGYLGGKVPLGLVEANWGGTCVEAWVGTEAILASGVGSPRNRVAAKAAHEMGLAWEKGGRERYAKDVHDHEAKFDRYLDVAPEKGPSAPGFDLSKWRTVKLPVMMEDHIDAAFNGVVYYAKELDLDADEAGAAELFLPPVDDFSDTFVNGVKIGSGAGWNTPLRHAVKAGVLKAGRNRIVVRADDSGLGGGFNALWHKDFRLKTAKRDLPLAGEWKYEAFRETGIRPLDFDNLIQPNFFGLAYNAMIAPLFPMAVKGAIWYQGCSNAQPAAYYDGEWPEDGVRNYAGMFRALKADWRGHFTRAEDSDDEMAFYLVEIAPYGKRHEQPCESNWARICDILGRLGECPKERTGAHDVTGTVFIGDVGEPNDIHPRDKDTVGRRLARLAANRSYGMKNLVPTGPTPTGCGLSGDGVVVRFANAGDGLKTRDGASVAGFELAGADGGFVRVASRITGKDAVTLDVPKGMKPRRVRHAWDDCPYINLVNGEGIPTTVFEIEVK